MTTPPVRDVGAVRLLQDLLPGEALSILAILTRLGSVPFAVAVLVAGYWFGPRERGALGLAAGLGAVALTVGLKALFALPRPPAAVQLIEASGFGFPSGHAIVATVVWGHLALALDRGARGRRLGAAGAVVLVVGLSRVALGVHHAVDVIAGVAVGVGLLLALHRRIDARRAFLLVALLAGAAVLVTGGSGDALLILGGALAGILLPGGPAVPGEAWGRRELPIAALGGGAVGALLLAGYQYALPAPVEFAIGGGAVAAVLALPGVLARYRSGVP